jgi:hypothetical protein
MTHLYSCRPAPNPEDGFAVTKFDADFTPEEGASYLTTNATCTCKAGVRPTCRHRQMLSLFFAREHVGDGWFLDWDTRMWHRPAQDEYLEGIQQKVDYTANYMTNEPPLPVTGVILRAPAPDEPACPDVKASPSPSPVRRRV